MLTNENKHRRLTPQEKTRNRRVRVDTAGGGAVEWTPGPGAAEVGFGEGGSIEFGPGGGISFGPGGVRFGPGVSIGGVPVDPRTQRPAPSPTQTVTDTIYV